MNYMYSFCRKVVPVVAISACLLSSTAISASAAMLSAEQSSVFQSSSGTEARMTLISECDCFISADGSMVYADASVSGYSGEATKCKITLSIQEKIGSSWKTVGTWSESQNSDTMLLSHSIKATKGHEYRAKATVTVWSGSRSESKTITTEAQKFN